MKRSDYLPGIIATGSLIILSACGPHGLFRAPGIDAAVPHPSNPEQSKPPITIVDTPSNYLDSALLAKVSKRDGTNILGVYMGMIAEWDGCTNGLWPHTDHPPYAQGVMMFSATSGELLKWISYEDFKAIFVDKTKPEYPSK